MSNSFNISVKPEIAAVSAIVTDNQIEIASIRGADLATLIGEIDENQTLLVDVTNPGIVNLASAIANNAVSIGLIRSEDVPALDSLLDINTAHLVTIDSLADAIKLKTDTIQQNVRGKVYSVQAQFNTAVFADLINISGHGKLYKLSMQVLNEADTGEIRVTLDGWAYQVFSFTGSSITQVLFPKCDAGTAAYNLMNLDITALDTNLFNLEFDTSLRVEVRRSAGTASNIYAQVSYTLDRF